MKNYMKKDICRALLTAAVLVIGLAGCSGTQKAEDSDVRAEESHYYSIEAYGLDTAFLYVTTTDDSGNSITEETGSQGFFGNPGMTLSQLTEEWNITNMEAKCDEFELLGWQAYENVLQVDEDGFETYSLEKLYDGKLFSTEEMLEQELPNTDVCFLTVWDLICSKCKEHKVCEVYYVDDDCYFICDDCYGSFAKEMGME